MTVPQELLAFEPDLIFSSKIESVSHKFGVAVKVMTSVDEILKELGDSRPTALTLNLDGLQGKLDVLAEIRKSHFLIFAYYSHVNTALAEEAKRLRIGAVLTRGAFVSQFPEMLRKVLSRK